MIYRNLSNAEYHARPEISKSDLDKFLKSPAHYYHDKFVKKSEPTPAMRFGSAFHTAVLEPDKFAIEYVVEPEFGDCRKPANKEKRDKWREDNASASILSYEEMGRIKGMQRAIHSHSSAARLLDSLVDIELSVVVENTGVRVRSRFDGLTKDNVVLDLKSTQSAHEYEFEQSIRKYRYDVQDVFYQDNARSANIDVSDFLFIACETEAPFALQIFSVNLSSRMEARQIYQKQLRYVKDCQEIGSYPGYDTGIKTITVKKWRNND